MIYQPRIFVTKDLESFILIYIETKADLWEHISFSFTLFSSYLHGYFNFVMELTFLFIFFI